jgi:SAM-dependent methyltransferase
MNTWKHISDSYFDSVTDKTVLEIGPLDGKFTELLLNYQPKKLCLLEFDSNWYTQLCNKYCNTSKVTVIHGDMHKDLLLVGSVDVVVALGVIYHSHAPLYLLEEIVNICNPEIILLDSPGSEPGNVIRVNNEDTNKPGMRIIEQDVRCCNLTLNLGHDIIIQAMSNMGYHLENFEILPSDGEIKVSKVPLFKFKKI